MTYINNVNTCMPVYGCGHVHERDSVKKGKHCVLQCVSHVLIHASLYMKVHLVHGVWIQTLNGYTHRPAPNI